MKIVGEALTFDDVLLVPSHSKVLPHEVNLESHFSRKIKLNIPLVSAAMDTVTESKAAITMAQEGGLGIIHKNGSVEFQALEVEKVKKSEWGMILDPVTIAPGAKISQALELMARYKISGVPVTEKDSRGNRLVGILTNRDLRFEEHLDQTVESRMTKTPLVTVPEGTTMTQAKALLKEKRIEKLPVVDGQGYLKGLITIKDIEKQRAFPRANKDQFGRLVCGAAVGIGQEGMARVEALIAANVDVLCVDSAHGHSENVLKMVHEIKKRFGDKAQVVGGNIGTYEGAKALIEAGADAVKVGIGGGSICTTRIIAGIGVPQLYAVSEAARACREKGVPLIADGGIRYSGDIVKALAAGAQSVMLGSLFAGTDEAPGEIVLFQGRSYKVYRGMGSLEAMSHGSGARDRYFQADIEDVGKMVPEGIEGRVPYRGSLGFNVQQLLGGIRSGLGYCGAGTIDKLHETAKFLRISSSGLRESHPHDIMITKEAPNYRLNPV